MKRYLIEVFSILLVLAILGFIMSFVKMSFFTDGIIGV